MQIYLLYTYLHNVYRVSRASSALLSTRALAEQSRVQLPEASAETSIHSSRAAAGSERRNLDSPYSNFGTSEHRGSKYTFVTYLGVRLPIDSTLRSKCIVQTYMAPLGKSWSHVLVCCGSLAEALEPGRSHNSYRVCYFGCLKRSSKSVQILFAGIE